MNDEIPQGFIDNPVEYAFNELALRKVREQDERERYDNRMNDIWTAWANKADEMLAWAKVLGLTDFKDTMYAE